VAVEVLMFLALAYAFVRFAWRSLQCFTLATRGWPARAGRPAERASLVASGVLSGASAVAAADVWLLPGTIADFVVVAVLAVLVVDWGLTRYWARRGTQPEVPKPAV
jgi:hypothetical protein